MKNIAVTIIILFCLQIFLLGCSKNIITSQNKCSRSYDKTLSYSYKNNTLRITHSGLMLNCCLKRIEATYKISGNVIIIDEKEILDMPCKCICNYTVTMKITKLPAKKYIIKTYNIQMEADLTTKTNDIKSLSRNRRRRTR